MAITAKAPNITASERQALRDFTTNRAGSLSSSPPGLMGSVDADVTLETRDVTRLTATSAAAAIVEAQALVASDPLGQARAVVDAGNGARWALRAMTTPVGGAGTVASPLYLSDDVVADRTTLGSARDGLEALVDDRQSIVPTADGGAFRLNG